MKIPPLTLTPAYSELKAEIDAAVMAVLGSGTYIGGEALEAFEAQFASYCGASHCVGTGNGLDSLHLALRGLGIGPGDEVIVASNSFIATLLAVSAVGAKPVLVEPDHASFNLDPARIEAGITPRTAAILPTHLFGHPCNLDPILAICARHGLKLIEDAAQAQGTEYRGQRIGAHGDAVCWSFYPTKNLGAMGDAGAVTTNDPELAARIRQLGNYGSATRYINELKGVNSRLDPVQAAIMSVKLRHLDRWNDQRRAIAGRYRAGLADCGLLLPSERAWAKHVWHQFVVRSPRRDELQTGLAERGVGTLVHYPVPPHLQQAYADLARPVGSFPIAEELAAQSLSLPIWPQMSDKEVELVIESVRSEAAGDMAA